MNTIITITNIDSLSAKDLELFSNYMKKKGLEFEISQSAPAPSKKEKSAPKKTAKAKSAKKSDDFDRVTYQRIADLCGCLGKHGVWKSCRQWVYAVMDGSMTLEDAQAKVKALKVEKGWA